MESKGDMTPERRPNVILKGIKRAGKAVVKAVDKAGEATEKAFLGIGTGIDKSVQGVDFVVDKAVNRKEDPRKHRFLNAVYKTGDAMIKGIDAMVDVDYNRRIDKEIAPKLKEIKGEIKTATKGLKGSAVESKKLNIYYNHMPSGDMSKEYYDGIEQKADEYRSKYGVEPEKLQEKSKERFYREANKIVKKELVRQLKVNAEEELKKSRSTVEPQTKTATPFQSEHKKGLVKKIGLTAGAVVVGVTGVAAGAHHLNEYREPLNPVGITRDIGAMPRTVPQAYQSVAKSVDEAVLSRIRQGKTPVMPTPSSIPTPTTEKPTSTPTPQSTPSRVEIVAPTPTPETPRPTPTPAQVEIPKPKPTEAPKPTVATENKTVEKSPAVINAEKQAEINKRMKEINTDAQRYANDQSREVSDEYTRQMYMADSYAQALRTLRKLPGGIDIGVRTDEIDKQFYDAAAEHRRGGKSSAWLAQKSLEFRQKRTELFRKEVERQITAQVNAEWEQKAK